MPKFQLLKDGVNEQLLKVVNSRVDEFLKRVFEAHELVHQDNIYSFDFGTVQISVQVKPWHQDDVLVYIYSYLAQSVELNMHLAEELLRLNATVPFGSFGITFDKSVIYSYCLPGTHLEENDFYAALQTVASVADNYDEKVLELKA
jgi:hypothetical protein